MAGTGPRRTMGLCVHPALPWSRAGQAGIWGQARNSFPWRGPPHPLPGCTALWEGGRAGPTLSPSEPRQWNGDKLGGRHWGIGTPESSHWTGLFTCEAFWTHYVIWSCGSSAGKRMMKSVGPRKDSRKVAGTPSLTRQRASLLNPQLDGALGSAPGPRRLSWERIRLTPQGNESPVGCS